MAKSRPDILFLTPFPIISTIPEPTIAASLICTTLETSDLERMPNPTPIGIFEFFLINFADFF